MDSLVDAAVDHVVPDDTVDTEEQLPDPDNTAQSMYKETPDGKNLFDRTFLLKIEDNKNTFFSSPEPLGSQGELIGWP